jgi:hypothetical protein
MVSRIVFGLCRMGRLRVRDQAARLSWYYLLTALIVLCPHLQKKLNRFLPAPHPTMPPCCKYRRGPNSFVHTGTKPLVLSYSLLFSLLFQKIATFVYDGCIASVETSVVMRENNIKGAMVPTSIEDAPFLGGDPSSADPIRYDSPAFQSFQPESNLLPALSGGFVCIMLTLQNHGWRVWTFFSNWKRRKNTNDTAIHA